MKRYIIGFIVLSVLHSGCSPRLSSGALQSGPVLQIREDKNEGTISVFRADGKTPLLTQNAKNDFRPFIHPIVAPDGKGVITEFSPGHHKWQMGIYWGYIVLNGRDYFRHWLGDYWRRVDAHVVAAKGGQVKWQTVYDLLDENGNAILRETQNWSMQEQNGKYLLDLEWSGHAKTDITVGKYYAGGLFVRMPWREGIAGDAVNAAGQRNKEAETQRAIWTDVGLQIEGRDDQAHIAIFDHPDNKAFPINWRVDNELGIGPCREIAGDWKIEKDQTENIRYRLVIYTGSRNAPELTRLWKDFICGH